MAQRRIIDGRDASGAGGAIGPDIAPLVARQGARGVINDSCATHTVEATAAAWSGGLLPKAGLASSV